MKALAAGLFGLTLWLAGPAAADPAPQSYATGYHLISFLSKASEPCQTFRAVLAQVGTDLHIPVVYIDTEATHSHDYTVNIKFFEGSEIPYTVLLDSGNHPLKRWTGPTPAATIEAETRKAMKL